MTRHISKAISLGCALGLATVPVLGLYFIWRIDLFAELSRAIAFLHSEYQWATVVSWQWYTYWLLTALYYSIVLLGLYFLGRVFANFAEGVLYETSNGRDLKRFAILLSALGVASPLQGVLSSFLFTFNHAPGEGMISLTLSSQDLSTIVLGVVLWVMSDLLLAGGRSESDNQQLV
jgi:hypothetical protein|tara:strand:+ start:177 stop:704 length:528 start_codon:yes stop_codon:yes gene_type:complete